MFLSAAANYIKLTYYITKLHISSALQYRANFLFQIFGMFFNDAALTIIWMIFFRQFPSINGWQFEDTALLLGISWTGFFIMNFSFGGIMELNQIIMNGQLDQYLLLPKNLIWQIAVSKSNYIEIGSFIVCLYLFYLSGYVTLIKIPLLICVILLSAIISFNFLLMVGTLTFYLGNIEYASNKLLRTLFDLIYFPQSVFTGIVRLIMMTVIPAFFLSTIPMNLIKKFNLTWFIILIIFTILQTIFALLFFNNGLKKYESGSLINVKL